MAGRRRFSETQKQQILDGLADSGLSVERYAKRYKVSASALARWRKAAAHVPKRPTVTMVDLGGAVSQPMFELQLASGDKLSIAENFDATALKRLVGALR